MRESRLQRAPVQPRRSAVNMTLPAFAAERRAAAPCSVAVAAGYPALAAVDRYRPIIIIIIIIKRKD